LFLNIVGGGGVSGGYQQMEFLPGRMLGAAAALSRDKAALAAAVGGGYYSVINPPGAGAAATPTGYTLLHQGVKRSLNDLGNNYGAASGDKRPRYF